jgi:thiamine-phosphate pyrophosphorylase
VAAGDALETAGALLRGGVDLLQLRAKAVPLERLLPLAEEVARRCADSGVPFVVNDHARLAAEVGAAGVHLGQDDGPVTPPGSGLLVGRSTHSLAQAVAAWREGAAYIGYGPLFPTPTKPGRPAVGLGEVAAVHAALPETFPVFCIGGVNLETLAGVVRAGARRVVVVSALLRAPDIALYIARAKAILPPLAA